MGGRLADAQIALIKAWIEQGADWPEGIGPQVAATGTHWAFIPPKRPRLPAVKDTAWVKNPIDDFVLARLEKEGLSPSPEAGRALLLRRLSLDLTGLPPAPKEVTPCPQPGRNHHERMSPMKRTSHSERAPPHQAHVARSPLRSKAASLPSPRVIWLAQASEAAEKCGRPRLSLPGLDNSLQTYTRAQNRTRQDSGLFQTSSACENLFSASCSERQSCRHNSQITQPNAFTILMTGSFSPFASGTSKGSTSA